jgi:hypothetical protein
LAICSADEGRPTARLDWLRVSREEFDAAYPAIPLYIDAVARAASDENRKAVWIATHWTPA